MARKTNHKNKPINFDQRLPGLIILFGVLLICIVSFIILVNPNHKFDIRSKAQITPVKLSLSPPATVIPPNRSLSLVIDSGSEKIAYIRAEVTFNPNLIQLTGDIGTSEKLRMVLRKSTRDQANSLGRIVVILGLAPADRANPPVGQFEIAKFNFTAKSISDSSIAQFSIDSSALQVVNWDASEMETKIVNASWKVNPKVENTPTDIPPKKPEPTVYHTPFPTITPYLGVFLSATPEPTPTITQLAIYGDTTGDRCVNLSDLAHCSGAIFGQGGPECDANADGKVNFSDTVYILTYLGNGCTK